MPPATTPPDGPRVLAGDDKFRIVRVEDGKHVSYVIELPDGADALGVERWREARSDSRVVTVLRDWIIRTAIQESESARETGKEAV